ncbi:MAG TPA: c-type cytochrome [Actinomycetota bacterium]|nr:c-type cytochrome [Actinomycetota bacterium]
MSRTDVFVLALVVLLPAALLWGIFLARTGRPGSRALSNLGIPRALRPGAPDEVLEGPRLFRIQLGGVVFTVLSVVVMSVYWFPEATRQEAFQERFDEESVHRGSLIFKPPAVLPEGVGAVEFKEIEEGVALGMNCASCHGGDAGGGTVKFVDPATSETVIYKAPPLNNVFTRWDEEVIRFTIERGRPGTPMPAWGVQYGGPMTSAMVSDVILWLKTLPGNQEPPEELADDATGQEIFEARCAVCHGPQGNGRDGGAETQTDSDTGDVLNIVYQGMPLWKGNAASLSDDLHFLTIRNGRRFGFMPAFGEAPTQGIPIPPYPLTDEQIRAVMEYERSL